MRYLARRLLHGLLLLVGVSVLSFAFISLAPGDYFNEMRLNPQIAPERVVALRAQFGLDRPLPVRYLNWVKSALHGQFGYSFAYNSPAGPLLAARARNTLLLTGIATLLAWLIALPLGAWIATRQGTWADKLLGGATSLLLAIPDLVLALGFLLIALRTGWLPVGGMVSPGFDGLGAWAKLADRVHHLVAPVAVLVLGICPMLIRHVRAAMIEVLQAPFLRAARAHGISEGRVLFGYALRATLNPLTALLGFSVAALLSGSLLVEVIMGWPGIGPLLLEAVLARDPYLVVGTVMFSTLFLIGGNLLADVLLYACDPRIRTEADGVA